MLAVMAIFTLCCVGGGDDGTNGRGRDSGQREGRPHNSLWNLFSQFSSRLERDGGEERERERERESGKEK